MKFSGREDVEVSIEALFEALCDYKTFERQAMRRGADVRRVDTGETFAIGASWNVTFVLRGRRRNMDIALKNLQAPNMMLFWAKSSGMEASFEVELLAMSRKQTRIYVAMEMYPQNLASRLLVQSLKLAKGSLNKRFKARLTEYTKTLEGRLTQRKRRFS